MNIIKTRKGAELYLYRANTKNDDLSAIEYTPDKYFKIGVDEIEVFKHHTSLVQSIPITNGVVLDEGVVTLMGSNGGNNSTTNSITFKPGGGKTDNTAQNLLTNTTSTIKQWHLTLGSPYVDDQKYIGLWLYFTNDALDVLTTNDCVEFRFGSDSSNYYYYIYNKDILQTGWNWFDLGVVNTFDEQGTVVGDIDYFSIVLNTNNASDVWASADVVYDLLRQWEDSDIIKEYVNSYPNIQTNNLEVIKKGYVTSTDAVGFNINSYADFNDDTTKLMTSKAIFKSRSKTVNDELIFLSKDRIIL